MAIQGSFFGLDSSDLSTLKTNYLACLNAIATTGQKYNMYGREFERADLAEVRQTLQEITAAQRRAAGTRVTAIYSDFRR